MREAPNYELAIMMQSMEETEGKHSDADGRNVGWRPEVDTVQA